ncbi:hypothetical protein P8452_66174 [Trifolium repens]|jgi:hypothetical protein|nr:hypothetical protein QL285_088025 [Trifolium repens]WJX83514.1 hypothetical protein P8452_66174 [Trifolium repens]
MVRHEVYVKYDHFKKSVKMYTDGVESLSELKNMVNHYLELKNETIRVSAVAYHSRYISLEDNNDRGTVVHSWEIINDDADVQSMFSTAEYDEGPLRLYARTTCSCH